MSVYARSVGTLDRSKFTKLEGCTRASMNDISAIESW
jgi:hypothetical protein